MSPSEIATRNTANNVTVAAPVSQRKNSMRGPLKDKQSLLLRITSPLTPWESNHRSIQRKSSFKGSNRQLRTLKTNSKENKRKAKSDTGLEGKQRGNNKPKCDGGFIYHPDINQYMKEYNASRLSKLKETNSKYEEYGTEEITKAYESLGVPKFSKGTRVSSTKKNFFPAVGAHDTLEENSPEVEEKLVTDSEDSSDDEEDRMTSPEARERRNNLNLSPLRKPARLPDLHNFPVQTVSGINLLELARLAAARAESTGIKTKPDIFMFKSSPRTSPSPKKFMSPSLHLQEKVMCRVVDLALPSNREIPHLKTTKPVKALDDRDPLDSILFSESSETKQQTNGKVKSESGRLTKIKKLDLNTDDPLALAIETSRSTQSSVLSQAVNSSSPHSTGTPHRSPTVKEVLASAIRNLEPLDLNRPKKDFDQTEKKEKVDEVDTKSQTKLSLSLSTYRRLSYKPSMRKFIESLYRPAADNHIKKIHTPCSIEGKPLQKLCELPEPPSSNILDKKKSRKQKKDRKFSSSFNDSTALQIKSQQRQQAAEKFERFKDAIKLEYKKSPTTKLAIVSKCQTVVKPQVSIKFFGS